MRCMSTWSGEKKWPNKKLYSTFLSSRIVDAIEDAAFLDKNNENLKHDEWYSFYLAT